MRGKIVYIGREEEQLCIYSPGPDEWENGFVWSIDGGGVIYF